MKRAGGNQIDPAAQRSPRGVAAHQQAGPTGPLCEHTGMFCKRVPAFWDNQRRHETLLQQT